MNRDDLIKELTENPEIKSFCRKVAREDSGDLIQDVAIILLKYPLSKVRKIKCAQCFIIGIISNLVFSKTSPFYYQYKKYISNYSLASEPLDKHYRPSEYITMECIERNLPDMYWFDRRIFKDYLKLKDMKKVAEKNKISHSYIFRTITKIRKYFKSKCL